MRLLHLLKINHEILQKEHWTLTNIEDRTQQLIAEIARLYPYYEAKDSSVTKVPICIDYQNAYAQGYYFPDNGSVEVLEGSTLYMDLPSPESYPEVEVLRAELKDNGILREDNQQLVFATNHSFYPKRVNATALSTTAAIILHGSRNGWESWMNEEGVQLGQVEGLRKNNE